MALINPHINFNGNAEEAFNFYKSVFGGEFAKVMRFKDLASPEFPVSEKEENKVTVRSRSKADLGTISIDEFIEKVLGEIKDKKSIGE